MYRDRKTLLAHSKYAVQHRVSEVPSEMLSNVMYVFIHRLTGRTERCKI